MTTRPGGKLRVIMKSQRLRSFAVFFLLFCAGIAALLTALHLRGRSAGNWLAVSPAVFSYATKDDGLHSLFAVTVTNIGRTDVEYQIRWFDCKAKTNRTWAGATRSSLASRGLLPRQTAAKVAWDLGPNAPKDEYLCCCAFDWQQHPSWVWHAAAKWVDPALAWLQNCFQPGWKAYTWGLSDWVEPLSDGVVFTSNVQVDDYFRQFYGLDSRKPQSQVDPSPSAGDAKPAEQIKSPASAVPLEVQRAFNRYCITKAPEDQTQSSPPPAKSNL